VRCSVAPSVAGVGSPVGVLLGGLQAEGVSGAGWSGVRDHRRSVASRPAIAKMVRGSGRAGACAEGVGHGRWGARLAAALGASPVTVGGLGSLSQLGPWRPSFVDADPFPPTVTCGGSGGSPVRLVPRLHYFGTQSLEAAMKNPKALAVVRKEVKPERETNTQRHFARLWWQFAWPRPVMRKAVSGLSRYISSTLHGKRLLFVWADPSWCPSNSTGVIALDDDYAMGVLCSRAHGAWAWSRSSSLATRLRCFGIACLCVRGQEMPGHSQLPVTCMNESGHPNPFAWKRTWQHPVARTGRRTTGLRGTSSRYAIGSA